MADEEIALLENIMVVIATAYVGQKMGNVMRMTVTGKTGSVSLANTRVASVTHKDGIARMLLCTLSYVFESIHAPVSLSVCFELCSLL